jgi:predicted branched-subunit amino acid permease
MPGRPGRGRTCATGTFWVAASPCGAAGSCPALGIAFGARIPPEWDIDFAVPLTFIALLTLLVKERAGQAAALVAALAVLALAALPYRLGLVLAIVLGLLAGAAVARRGEARR